MFTSHCCLLSILLRFLVWQGVTGHWTLDSVGEWTEGGESLTIKPGQGGSVLKPVSLARPATWRHSTLVQRCDAVSWLGWSVKLMQRQTTWTCHLCNRWLWIKEIRNMPLSISCRFRLCFRLSKVDLLMFESLWSAEKRKPWDGTVKNKKQDRQSLYHHDRRRGGKNYGRVSASDTIYDLIKGRQDMKQVFVIAAAY